MFVCLGTVRLRRFVTNLLLGALQIFFIIIIIIIMYGAIIVPVLLTVLIMVHSITDS